MARHRRLLFLSVLATLTLCGSGTAGGITGFGRAALSVTGATGASTTTRDAVLPHQPRPDVVSAVRRSDRERTGRPALVATAAGSSVHTRRTDAHRGGAAFREMSALTAGSRAPPIAPSFFLR